MPGFERILRGILNYESNLKGEMIHKFRQIKDNPQPKSVMFWCMDSRVIATRILGSEPGDHFLVRNAGNLVTHNDSCSAETMTTEPGALHIGCVSLNIRHVMVCGHSDCKAMNLLYSLKDEVNVPKGNPLELWVKRNGKRTVEMFETYKALPPNQPLVFDGPVSRIEAFIDPANKFEVNDKFSQINTLVQMQNIESYPFMKERILEDKVRLNAFWFDIYTGDFYMFSRARKQFLEVLENFQHLAEDGDPTKHTSVL